MRRAVLALSSALAMLMLPFAPVATPTASAAPSDIVAIVIDGTGNGHGRGLSQWGAYGWAVNQGWDWQQILDHYYGGTILGDWDVNSRMTVRLLGMDGQGAVGVVSYEAGVTWGSQTRTSMRAVKSPAGDYFDVYASASRTCGAADEYLGSAATVSFTTAGSEVSGSSASAAVGVCEPDGSVTHYRGSIDTSVQPGLGVRVVNNLRTEDYLRGVVPREVAASWADAGGGAGANAVRAQAVAARSYALSQNRYASAKTCDTTACQAYDGAARRVSVDAGWTSLEDPRSDQAIATTAGKIRVVPGNPAPVSTEFSASNGPRTAGGTFPVRDDALGDSTPGNPNHRWTRVLDADTLAAQYGLGSITSATMVEAAASQYQQYDGIWYNDIVLTGSNGQTKRMNAWDFRGAQGLPSPGFTIRVVTRDSVSANVALIGDSVGESAKDEFTTLTDGTFTSLTIDTLVSRFITKTPPSPSGVQVAGTVPMNLDVAIVELGYNLSTNMAADIDAMMNALNQRGTKRVVWVNMAEIKSGYAAANAALFSARSRWPNLVVADWNAASAAAGIERARWISSDGVHLTTTGQAEFSLWLRQLVGGSGPIGGNFTQSRRFAPNQRIELQVVGANVVGPDGATRAIPAGASAVALNITAVDPAAPGFITVWPCDVARPDASNLNYVTGGVVANGVIAPVGASGKVCFYSNQQTEFLVDISGWFSGASSGGLTFVGATPRRVIDTRNAIGGPKVRIPAGGTISIPLAGAAMQRTDGSPDVIPANATAVAMNVTAVTPSQAGFFTVWPCSAPMPNASNVNFTPGAVVANGVVASLGSSGSVCIYSNQQSDVLVDVLGWFAAGDGQPPYTGAVPQRLVDTRNAIGGPTGVITPSTPKAVPVRGVTLNVNGVAQQVPADASAVALNVTIVNAQAAGFATVWPCGTPMPEASNVNFARGATAANGVIAPIGADGSVCIYTYANAHLIVDIAGWFSGGDAAAFTGNIPKRLVDTRNNIGPAPF